MMGRHGRKQQAISSHRQLQLLKERDAYWLYWKNAIKIPCFCILTFTFVASFLFFTIPRIPEDPITIPPPPPPPTNPLNNSRVAICLFGGGRRFDLTAASIQTNLLQEFPNADLFVVSPLDAHSYKFLLLKDAPRIASIDITSDHSPDYIEHQHSCVDPILQRERQTGFEYDWIVLTRADGYWSGPLRADVFDRDRYVVPQNSLPVGELSEKFAVASRDIMTELILQEGMGVRRQLYGQKAVPVCMVSDGGGVVSSIGKSAGNGEECRPCRALKCVGNWERGWEAVFDRTAGAEAARMRRMIEDMSYEGCVREWKNMLVMKSERQGLDWDLPSNSPHELCKPLQLEPVFS